MVRQASIDRLTRTGRQKKCTIALARGKAPSQLRTIRHKRALKEPVVYNRGDPDPEGLSVLVHHLKLVSDTEMKTPVHRGCISHHWHDVGFISTRQQNSPRSAERLQELKYVAPNKSLRLHTQKPGDLSGAEIHTARIISSKDPETDHLIRLQK
jgi:hypothetical protein